jgi:hypothetical protein
MGAGEESEADAQASASVLPGARVLLVVDTVWRLVDRDGVISLEPVRESTHRELF